MAVDAPGGRVAARRPFSIRERQPALDGLRGVAVVLVVLYHLGVDWLPGGFLGVDVFFVLSGFLITSLLVDAQRRTGRIDLRAFWIRRSRRLLPALLVLLAAVAVYAAVDLGVDRLRATRLDGLAALFYVANWRAILSGHAYMDQFASASPLMHTWSLAIEEQWYLVWPIAVAVAFRFRRRLGAALVGAVVLAGGSAVLMALWFRPGHTSRAYYGTDARAQALLVGAALAFAVARWGRAATPLGRRTVHAAAIGAAGLSAWCWVTVHQWTPWMYRGGFLLAALATAAVVLSIVQGDGPLARALALRPLRAIGLVSYGLYLWHWPVIVVLSKQRTGLGGFDLLSLRLAVSVALTLASYWLVEMPVRRGALRARHGWTLAPLATIAVVVALVASTAGGRPVVVVADTSDVPPPTSLAGSVTPEPPGTAPTTASATAPTTSLPSATTGPTASAPPGTGGTTATTAAPTTTAPAGPVRVLVVGDSVATTLGAGMARTQDQFGLLVWDQGMLGCGLSAPGRVRIDGQVLDSTPKCDAWPERWAGQIDEFRPQLVVVLTGTWDGYDRQIDGTWLEVGTPEWADHLLGLWRGALDVLSARGAHVVVLTTPYLESSDPNSPDHPDSAFDPDRVDALNAVMRQAAAEAPDRVTLVDLNAFVCPEGHYQPDVAGVADVRGDGVHFTPSGADFVASWLAPQIVPLAPR
jgi:peptidoglycan/LPS O-acetylase OafA/YrhL